MRRLRTLLLTASLAAFTAGAQQQDGSAAAPVQQLFSAMASHNTEAAKALFTPGATLSSLRPDGTVSTTSAEQFAEHIGTAKDALLERTWNPKILEQGNIASYWAEYDFHLNGKFHHCGIDALILIKTASGWKISSIGYTSLTQGCSPSPLGPPSAGK
jgi:hypothetical protein